MDERRNQILSAARARAADEGWAAVTTRHLAEAIGYSQPVLYGHFPGGKAEIMLAVALEGFLELSRACKVAVGNKRGRKAIEAVSMAYLEFAEAHPSVYEVMFQETITTPFASDDTLPELREGFQILSSAIGADGNDAATEVFWAALHGIARLERTERMRPEHRAARIHELTNRFAVPAQKQS